MPKLLSYEVGQMVMDLSGAHYKVASKATGPDGVSFRFIDSQGRTASGVIPVSFGFARFASFLRFHLAYNKDFDLYVRAYCEQAGLPIPVGPDGQAFRWADWLQSTVSPKLITHAKGLKDMEAVKDEAIHEMLFTELGHRNILGKFKAAIKNFHKDIRKLPVAKQLTVYLTKNFRGRVEEMNRKIKEQTPSQEVSLTQEGDGDRRNFEEEEVNILDTEEFAKNTGEFQSIESAHDIKKFRSGFYHWLKSSESGRSAKGFIALFDIYWQWVNTSGENEDDEGRPAYLPARRDLQPLWQKKTRLSPAALYGYIGRLAKLLEQYVVENREELQWETAAGESNLFVKLIDSIHHEREKLRLEAEQKALEAKPKRKSKPVGAVASLTLAEMDHEKTANYNGWFEVEHGNAFFCPYCKTGLAATNWSTEYGDPLPGDHPVRCPNCNKDFHVDVEVSTNYRPRTASIKVAKLVRGDELTPEMLQQVKDTFVSRWTSDNPQRISAYGQCSACDINTPFAGGSAEGHNHPTISLQTDDEWVDERSFHFTNDDRLFVRRGAEPAYLAGERNPVLPKAAALDEGTEFRKLYDYMNTVGWRGRNPWYPEKYPFYAVYLYSDGWKFLRRDLVTNKETVVAEGATLRELRQHLSRYKLDELRSAEPAPASEPAQTQPAQTSGEFTPGDKTFLKSVGIQGRKKTAEFGENVFPPDMAVMCKACGDQEAVPGKEYCEGCLQDVEHLFCPRCLECAQCNLRPCRGGGEHMPGLPHDEAWRLNKEMARQGKLGSHVVEDFNLNDAVVNILEARADNMLTAEDWKIFREAVETGSLSSAVQITGERLLNTYDQEQVASQEEWEALRQAYEEDEFGEKQSTEPLQQLRPTITPGDTGRLPHGRMQGSLRPGLEKVWECRNCEAWGTDKDTGVEHSVNRNHGIRDLNEPHNLNEESTEFGPSVVTVSVRENGQEISSEEYTGGIAELEDYVKGVSAEHPEFTVVIIDEEGAVTEDSYVAGNHVGETVEKFAAMPMDSNPGQAKLIELLRRAAGSLQDYCSELNGDMNDSLAMEIEEVLKNFPKTAAAPVAPAAPATAVAPPTPTTLPVPTGTMTPQQMQQMNQSKSQGMAAPQPEQTPSNQNPAVAIMPSGRGEEGGDTSMKHTVPPEIPNQRYHMSSDDLVDRKRFFASVKRKYAGHFYEMVVAVGKNRKEAERNAIDEFLLENGHRHSVRGVDKARLIEKVPPNKQKETVRGRGRDSMTYVEYLPDPTAPENEWLEKWEFELHTHA
jgi:hypothetical protein